MPRGSRQGLTQIVRQQGIVWGDGAAHDAGLWIDGNLAFFEGDFVPKGATVYDVRAWGAKCDALTDDSAALNAILTDIDKKGNLGFAAIYIPPSYTVLTGPFTIKSDTAVMGAGVGATTLLKKNTTGHLFQSAAGTGATTNAANLTFRDFAVADGSNGGTHTTGAAIHLRGTDSGCAAIGVYIQNIQVEGVFNGIELNGSAVRQVFTSKYLGINLLGSAFLVTKALQSIHLSDSSFGSCVNGVYLIDVGGGSNVSGLHCSNVSSNLCGNGFVIAPGNGQTVAGCRYANCQSANCTNYAFYAAKSGTGVIRGISAVGCGFHGATNQGVYLDGAMAVDLTACDVFANGASGIHVTANTKDLAIVGGHVSGNSVTSSGTADGIYVAPGVTGLRLIGVRSGQLTGFANSQRYGINIDTGATDYYVIQGCDTHTNATGGLNDAGTGVNKSVTGNI